jgi:hypothetical protein
VELLVHASGEKLEDPKGEIAIETNIAHFERITIPVTGKLVAPVAVIPPLLNFGEIGLGETAHRSLVLRSLVNRPFRVSAVQPETDGLTWSVPLGDIETSSVPIAFTARGDTLQRISGTALRVQVESDGKSFDLEIPLFAAKKASP